MTNLVFDCETDGFLPELTKIHTIVIWDLEQKKYFEFTNSSPDYEPLKNGVEMLKNADKLIGHNIIKFDIPAIQKLFPDFNPDIEKCFDTMLAAKLLYPDIGLIDDKLVKTGILPKTLRGRYSLESFGYRLGELKGQYGKKEDAWEKWSPEMQAYCVQDVNVTKKLFFRLKDKIPDNVMYLEQKFAKIIGRQEQRGASFDKEKAVELASILIKDKTELEKKLKEVFPPEIKKEVFTPKRGNKTKGYKKGEPFIKEIPVEFNPNSRAMIAQRLIKKYNWKPKVFTPEGNPKVSEETLSHLNYPEVPLILQYLLISKILGYLSEGNNAWLKSEKNGIIYGTLDTLGAVTRRCTHRIITNIPAVTKDKEGNILRGLKGRYGADCRELFKAREGWNLVGCDASALELRMLAHYMKDEAYQKEILEGDIHTANQKAAGLPTRDNAKTFIYGFLYGAGDEKIGSIIKKGRKEGKLIKKRFLNALPKLNNLLERVKRKVKETGTLKSIDGSTLKVREQYKALNVLLQSAGGIVMKQALCILYDDCVNRGWIEDSFYLKNNDKVYFILNVHDEYQAEVKPEITEEYKKLAVEAIQKAGNYLKFRCPLTGEAKEGKNWLDTH